VIVRPGEPLRVQAELYDLNQDPEEHHALIDQQHPLLRSAWQALETELDRARAAWRDEPRTDRASRSTDLSDESLLELRALGYIDEDQSKDDVDPRRPWGLAPMDPVELEPSGSAVPVWIGVVGLAVVLVVFVGLRIMKNPQA